MGTFGTFAHHIPCVLSGCAASLGSVFGKLAFDSQSPACSACVVVCAPWTVPVHSIESCQALVSASCRILFTFLMISMNGLMLSLYMRALRESGSVVATVVNSATNFVLSAIFGVLWFQEMLSLQWWVGSMLIIVGVALLMRGGEAPPHQQQPRFESSLSKSKQH